MSILIKGMEMPKEEEISKCIIIRHDGEVWIVEFDNLVDNGFVACYPTNPMRAVPVQQHGRLGDMEALEQMFADIDHAPYSGFDGTEPFYSAEDAAQIIRLAPTIIPADPTEEGE